MSEEGPRDRQTEVWVCRRGLGVCESLWRSLEVSQADRCSCFPSAVQAMARQHPPGGRGDALSRECWKPLRGPAPHTVRMEGLKLREGKILSQSHTASKARGGLRLADQGFFPEVEVIHCGVMGLQYLQLNHWVCYSVSDAKQVARFSFSFLHGGGSQGVEASGPLSA